MNKEDIESNFKNLQNTICAQLEKADGKARFEEDVWKRKEGGGGITKIIQRGTVLEKGGVLFSAVSGPTPEKILNALNLPKADFYATGLSIVLHPANPWVPIIHMNVRYFEMSNGICWFGGGIDLTPHYIDPIDASYFHAQLKQVCDRHNTGYYQKFKEWADDYFFIPHRNETRGVGGIFFDKLSPTEDTPKGKIFNFVLDVGNLFAPVYCEIINRKKDIPYSEKEKQWQFLRRGRYVEFNLVYDKGTKFGLDTNGRTESILMSLPPTANWEYCHTPAKDSKEEYTLSLLKKGIDWIK